MSAIYWSQSVIAEVYTLASAFTSGILLCIFLWYRKKEPKYLLLAGFLGGLSTGVHANVSLILPAVVLFILIADPKKEMGWLHAILGALAGLAVMLSVFFLIDHNSGNHDAINTIYRPAISSWNLRSEAIDSPQERFHFLYTGTHPPIADGLYQKC
jgi:4-amino-4-deoxy-L-arabinose transferase-like glycosyltransferase